MTKIYKYELNRLLLNKFFLGLLVVTMVYSYMTMDSEIVLGVADTAPFSSWSFGAFLSQVLPLLMVTVVFFLSFIFSQNEAQVRTLTDATPVPYRKYMLIRYAAIGTGFVIISLAAIAVCLVFYVNIFHFTDFRGFFAPGLLALVPALLLFLGLGTALGKLHPALIYVLIPVAFLLPLAPLPYAVDLYAGRFFAQYPTLLGTVEPAFSVPVSVFVGKAVCSLVGIGLIFLGSNRKA